MIMLTVSGSHAHTDGDTCMWREILSKGLSDPTNRLLEVTVKCPAARLRQVGGQTWQHELYTRLESAWLTST